MKLGELIASERKRERITLRELATRCGLCYQSIYLIETGETTKPGWWTVVRLARGLDLPLDRVANCDEQEE